MHHGKTHTYLDIVPTTHRQIPSAYSAKQIAAHGVAQGSKIAVEDIMKNYVATVKAVCLTTAVATDYINIPSYNFCLWMSLHSLDKSLNMSREHHVIRVKKHHPWGRHFSQTSVASRCSPRGKFLDYSHVLSKGTTSRGPCVKHISRTVCATIVDKHHGALHCLRGNRVKCAPHEMLAIVDRNNYSYNTLHDFFNDEGGIAPYPHPTDCDGAYSRRDERC